MWCCFYLVAFLHLQRLQPTLRGEADTEVETPCDQSDGDTCSRSAGTRRAGPSSSSSSSRQTRGGCANTATTQRRRKRINFSTLIYSEMWMWTEQATQHLGTSRRCRFVVSLLHLAELHNLFGICSSIVRFVVQHVVQQIHNR